MMMLKVMLIKWWLWWCWSSDCYVDVDQV